ncbi:MAG TPA: MBL fold metallo-hydrolase, partial [Candidatus Saccharimonadaceae bacterium]|nr:MBL fold metallo-hydrolase [Candidatus Saccharimonadaceae bacterium]
YEHACFTLEKDGTVIVVDPGEYTTDFITPENVSAVIITHQHPDHFDHELLADIFAKNDTVLVAGPADVIDKVEIETKQAVEPGEKLTVGPFDLEFFGGTHAMIHESMPRIQNIGVIINDLVYYPGDSLDVPNRPIDTLLVPAAAPWMRIGEAIDFLAAIKPRLTIPTHDAIYSDAGRELADKLLGMTAEKIDSHYQRPDTPIEI